MRPEITRLAETDPMPPGKLLGRGSGKNGRPTVTDLIKPRESKASLRETASAFRKKLADEREKYATYRRGNRYVRHV